MLREPGSGTEHIRSNVDAAISKTREPTKGLTHRNLWEPGNPKLRAVGTVGHRPRVCGLKAQGAITTENHWTQSPLSEGKARFYLLLSYFLFRVILLETRSCATPAGHKVTLYLRMALNKCWGFRHAPPYQFYEVFGVKPRALRMQEEQICVRSEEMAVRMRSLTSGL